MGIKMKDQVTDFIVKINFSEQVDSNEQFEISRQLQQEMLEFDVETVEPVTEDTVPDGAMAIEANLLDTFTVSFSAELAAALIAPIIFSTWNWLRRQKDKYREDVFKVEIKKGQRIFEITSTMSESEAQTMINALVPLFNTSSQEESQR